MKTDRLLYYRKPEQIEEYRALPARERLKWLEEAARFFYRAKVSNRKTRGRTKRTTRSAATRGCLVERT